MNILFVLLGGAAGTLARYGLGMLVQRSSGAAFPWGTLTVNLIGAFVIGILYESFTRVQIEPQVRLLLFTGLLGGFTTFSAFGVEAFNLFRIGATRDGIAYILLTNAGGLALVSLGILVSRTLVRALLR